MKYKILDWILEIQEKDNGKTLGILEENLRKFIIEVGENTGIPELVDFAKKLNRDGIEMCLHLGFSEKAFLESLQGIVEIKPYLIFKPDEK